MKARPERVAASSPISASLAPLPNSASKPVEAALEEQRRVAEDRVALHQAAGDGQGALLGDAAEAGDLGAAAGRP